MSTPSCEEVWAVVAANSICVCDQTFMPCLVHAREAAEVWIVMKGSVCVRQTPCHVPTYFAGVQGWRYTLVPITGRDNEVAIHQLHSSLGIPRSVRFVAGGWYSALGDRAFPSIKDVLKARANLRWGAPEQLSS